MSFQVYFLWLVFEDGKGGHPQNIFNSSQNSQSFLLTAWCVKPKWWDCLIIFVQILYFVFDGLVSRVWYPNCYFQMKEESELFLIRILKLQVIEIPFAVLIFEKVCLIFEKSVSYWYMIQGIFDQIFSRRPESVP